MQGSFACQSQHLLLMHSSLLTDLGNAMICATVKALMRQSDPTQN